MECLFNHMYVHVSDKHTSEQVGYGWNLEYKENRGTEAQFKHEYMFETNT